MSITRGATALFVGVLGAVLGIQPAFASGPPQAASGAVVITSRVPTSVMQADGNTIIEGTATAVISGTFTGTNATHFRLIMHPDGSFIEHESGVFTGQANGCGTGTAPFSVVLQGTAGAAPTGSVASVDQADNTANVVFELKLTGTPVGAVYTGIYHCTS